MTNLEIKLILQQRIALGIDVELNRAIINRLNTLHKLVLTDTKPPLEHAAALRLTYWAREVFARYGHPVYITGSALFLAQPRDLDIRVVIPDSEFEARWGNPRQWHGLESEGHRNYCAEMAKFGRSASMQAQYNVDFQVQSESGAAGFSGLARTRLDDLPDPPAEDPDPTPADPLTS